MLQPRLPSPRRTPRDTTKPATPINTNRWAHLHAAALALAFVARGDEEAAIRTLSDPFAPPPRPRPPFIAPAPSGASQRTGDGDILPDDDALPASDELVIPPYFPIEEAQ